MTVHAFHIFDRKGKTLFTKYYSAVAAASSMAQQNGNQGQATPTAEDLEQQSEQRKLIFGMLFSLRELVGSLAPEGEPAALHSVRTGASTLYNYETISGLRFAMYTDNEIHSSYGGKSGAGGAPSSSSSHAPSVRDALRHIYSQIWVENVVRSPLYRPGEIIPPEEAGVERNEGTILPVGKFEIRSTNFEKRLDDYLTSMPWFR